MERCDEILVVEEFVGDVWEKEEEFEMEMQMMKEEEQESLEEEFKEEGGQDNGVSLEHNASSCVPFPPVEV